VAELTLPDKHRDAIVSLLKLGADEGHRLIKQIEDCGSKNPTLIATLDEAVGNGKQVLRALVMFAAIPRRFGVSLVTVERGAKDSFGFAESAFPLAELLAVKPLQQIAKALDLRNAYERILVDSRIVSDIRPVFGDDDVNAGEGVEAAMVNHTLQLRFSVGEDEPKDFHLALDLDDLRKLRKQIDRALEKQDAAHNFIEQSGAIMLEPLELPE
jgi:hypothetical protein